MGNMKLVYIVIVGLLFTLASCSKDVPPDIDKSDSVVYLAITRAQITDAINEDTEDSEDRVYDLALLVFDSETGEKVCEYFDENISVSEKEKTFNILLTPGKRDFYFVGNMPMRVLKGISDKAEMKTYMNELRGLDESLYSGATSEKGFPMSRVYTDLKVTEGGTLFEPLPFNPEGENKVRLIRVVAKLEVDLTGLGVDIENVLYKNAYSQYSLQPLLPLTTHAQYHSNIKLKKKDPIKEIYSCYIPEVLLDGSIKWNANTEHKPINYFVIETKQGANYEIPIITYDKTQPVQNYLDYATTGDPDYSIYRNRHYKYVFSRSVGIEVLYNVTEWNHVKKSTFMGYWFNVELEGNKVSINNTVNACAPHLVELKTLNGCVFEDDETITKTFTDPSITANIDYTLKNIPASGDYLEVYYCGFKVKTFSK